jgi:TPP-dependent trihydroxycyclohexane-1,2-dione (THcHDO) dehydratase
MEWLEIIKTIATVVATIGGVGGFIAIYKAKAEKTGIDVNNMQSMLDEAHKMYDDAREETKELREEFKAYKLEMMEYVGEFKQRFNYVENRLEKTEIAVYQGYRCPFPPRQDDCPVLQEFNKSKCIECQGK